MSKTYRIILTPEAQSDIREIVLYIAHVLAAPQAALKLQEDLRKEICSLADMPKRIKTVDEQPWKDFGIRRTRVKNYDIYFLADDADLSVRVTAVIYVGRDQEKQMTERI